ncbi:uncharacterized protein LOC109832191 isoform X2 [Asparagus officinalis]|uniref:uncharacterized protein LOC109832191 isoform X2 n=1 Tax=Asparagus officinalis TaxID=4686 RepID=UPI00098E45A8|nr:uncharacterized protein LOC109832191 isoform X2 [Asparagus officinalis]
MAIRLCSPSFVVPAKRTDRSPTTRVQGQIKRGSTLYSANKVFVIEDQEIVCYRDEKGELICEGYDEGPRFTHQSHGSDHQRELHVPDSRRGRIRVEDGNDHYIKGVPEMNKVDMLMN